ncbi:Response regulator receiver domain-containing protein [Trichlorobacter thiogenes]|uniref:Response regulator receiver domain-containing protein n=1 Tax=Trichlorobacter thiogenes TaxID=115783 RepID=A0A1T4MGC6_9BACT|nr:response regulator [Trichlorobacter thiogenes]SJZ66140.1 Response regulator receiver domain-containing protein [Trichlorobacter thiogenes]
MDATEKLKQLTLLYVEDEDIARLSIGSFLRRYMGELLLASNGSEGLQLYQEKRPAVVITDLEMPVMNGMEMIRKIRELDHSIPIIITTAYDDDAHYCPEADLTILKPISFMELLQAVKDCLAAREKG